MNIETKNTIEGMKQNNNPMVLLKTLFCIVSNETKTKGYWKNKQGKVYIDNIEAKPFFAIENCAFNNAKQLLFAMEEEAVFWKDINNNAIIEDKEGNKTKLVNRIAWIETTKPSKEFIEALLENHEGFTVYELEAKVFLIEIYKPKQQREGIKTMNIKEEIEAINNDTKEIKAINNEFIADIVADFEAEEDNEMLNEFNEEEAREQAEGRRECDLEYYGIEEEG